MEALHPSTLNYVNHINIDEDILDSGWPGSEEELSWDDTTSFLPLIESWLPEEAEIECWQTGPLENSEEPATRLEYSYDLYEDADEIFFSDEEEFGEEFNDDYLESLNEVLDNPVHDRYRTTWEMEKSSEDHQLRGTTGSGFNVQVCKGLPLSESNKGYELLTGMGWLQG